MDTPTLMTVEVTFYEDGVEEITCLDYGETENMLVFFNEKGRHFLMYNINDIKSVEVIEGADAEMVIEFTPDDSEMEIH